MNLINKDDIVYEDQIFFNMKEELMSQTVAQKEQIENLKVYGSCDVLEVMLDDFALMPVRAHKWDAGLDILSPVKEVIWEGDSVVIDTGVHVRIPEGFVGMLKGKSGLNVRHGITGEGVIDSHYTGSIIVKLYKMTAGRYHIEKGDKIIQLVILPIATPKIKLVDRFPDTDRGISGFGSTGR